MKKIFALIISTVLLTGCAVQSPEAKIKYLQQNTLSQRIEGILRNPNLTEEQKKRLILTLFAQKRKEWSAQNIYTKEKAKKLAEMLSLPATPLHTPPKIMRVLILPWVDKNGVFHGAHYVYMQVDSGQWILGSYTLQNLEGASKTLTPLER